MDVSALYTDFYELTMAQGYYKSGNNPSVVFDMFFRKNPFDGGYAIFAGISDLLDAFESFRFSPEDIDYLRKIGIFGDDFLAHLTGFRFKGTVYAAREGDVVFRDEPVVRVHGNLIECQLIESLLLNTINFQTLIATKASRIRTAARGGKILEFGLRRAQGPDGAMSAARAAFIGGAGATSNTEAGKRYGIPVKGTMAHSWIMSFPMEYEAFKTYADLYPDSCVFLIDTYDTLTSGIDNAIRVGLDLKAKGHNFGVRLDSGDLCYLSVKVREKLDAAGLRDAYITVSNDLNEEIIAQLINDNSPIDIWGVGTQLVTGGTHASLSGVYKLCARGELSGSSDESGFTPVMKLSNNPEKRTNPGIKQVYRFRDRTGSPLADLVALQDEVISGTGEQRFYHPFQEDAWFEIAGCEDVKPLLTQQMKNGNRAGEKEELSAIRERAEKEIGRLDKTYKRILNPHGYKVSITEKLKTLKKTLATSYLPEG